MQTLLRRQPTALRGTHALAYLFRYVSGIAFRAPGILPSS